MSEEKASGFKHSVDVSFQYFAGKPILRRDIEDPTRYVPAFVEGEFINSRGLFVFIDKRIAASFIDGKSYRARGVVLYREGAKAAYFCPFMEKVFIEAGLTSAAYPVKEKNKENENCEMSEIEPDASAITLTDRPSLNPEY